MLIEMPLTSEQERWAEALLVQKLHGEAARVHIAERIGTLAIAGDAAGVGRWQEIARRLDKLLRPGVTQ